MFIHQQDIRAFHLVNELSQANLKPQISKVCISIDSRINYHGHIMLCINKELANLKPQISKLVLTWTNHQEFHLCSKLISKVNHQNSVSQLHKIIYSFMTTLPISTSNLKKYLPFKKFICVINQSQNSIDH